MELICELFLVFFKIGLVSIGGGYAIIPMISDTIVSQNHWLSIQQFSNIITISQMTPGPLAVNTSTFVGMQIAGVAGALTATIACISMGVTLSYVLYQIFSKYTHSKYIAEILKGLKASSLGLIVSAAAVILKMAFLNEQSGNNISLNIYAIMIFIVIVFLSKKFKLSPILLMLISGMMGCILYL